MDRPLRIATIVFAALAVAGCSLVAAASSVATAADAEALRVIGAALLGGGLAAFLGEAFRAARSAA